MQRKVVVALILTASAVALGGVIHARLQGVKVQLVPVTRGTVVEAVYATGRVDSDRRATVRARRPGPLLRVLVGPGEAVQEGQVVALQDPREAELQLAQRRQELAAAQASWAEARDAAERAEQLFMAGLVAENERIRLRERANELARRAQALQEAVLLAEEQLSWCTLRAPLTGTVASLLRRAGDVLREGDEILTIVNLDQAYLRVAVDERDLGKVRLGQEVRLVLDAYPEQPLVGSVWRIVPTVDRLTRAADVLVALPDRRPPLQLDLTATVNLVVRVVPEALVVPRLALQGTGSRRQVLVVGEDRRLQALPVTVGVCDLERCQVVEGLTPGTPVVADPSGLKVGQRVSAR
ncbi:MAG: efflux RND transporter periplasmic adaptor subunit [Thermoanaerobaculum sp.]|nr:efflux RND transporter periplasmic adaptor subunit [Thermoanaerobaculum sp.]MDW7968322.1 efflux RND transporter periplasmic adaptor subunit [Thermoanaerobaculum sp.]